MFKAPFSFNGRIRRLEYGLSYLIFCLYLSIGLILVQLLRGSDQFNNPDRIQIIFFVMIIFGYWFLFAQGARRCHDRGNSGWYQLIPFYVFFMLFADGIPGPNKYGPNPKGIGNFEEINEIGNYLQK